MQVLDFILAMTKATSDDKVRLSLHDAFNLASFLNVDTILRDLSCYYSNLLYFPPG